MTLQLGDEAPDFEADTTEGRIRFHDWIGDSWAVLFSHPKDFTPVCTTELGYMANAKPEFDAPQREDHRPLRRRPGQPRGVGQGHRRDTGRRAQLPDHQRQRLQRVEALRDVARGTPARRRDRTPADNQTVRNVFVIGPDKKIKLILIYPMTTGRNFDEVLRVIDSLQLTAKHKVATPVNWRPGEKVIIAGSVSNNQAKETYPDGWEEPKPLHPDRAAAELEPREAVPPHPLEQVLEDAGGGAPDHVLVDHERVRLEGEAASLHLDARPARAHLRQRQLQHASTSRADRRHASPRGILATNGWIT